MIEAIKDYSYQSGIQGDLTHQSSLLNENSFTDNIAFDQEFEGVPTSSLISGTFGNVDSNKGIQYSADKTTNKSYLQSKNFVTGSSGWRLDSDGNIEASSGTFRGNITGGSLNINNNSIIDSSGYATFVGLTTLNIKTYTNFENLTRFVTTNGGSGASSVVNTGLSISTGATATSYARVLWEVSNNVFNAKSVFTCTVQYMESGSPAQTGTFFAGIGVPTFDGSSFTETGKNYCGFEIKKVGTSVSLTAVQCNGTSNVDYVNDLTTLSNSDVLELIIKIKSTGVDYYWRKNGGTLSGSTTLSNYIPSGSETYLTFGATNRGNAENYPFSIKSAGYER